MSDVTESDGGAVERAVRIELALMGERAAASALGASVIDLARRQDTAESAGGAAQLAKELRAGLVELQKSFPPVADDDELDMLRKRRGA